MGRTIPQVAAVSGHRSWNSLKRYTHIRQSMDKYEKWKWKAPSVPVAYAGQSQVRPVIT